MGMIGLFKKMTEEEVERYRDGGDFPYGAVDCDIDKSWELIHYLLTGDIADGEPPLGYVIPLCDEIEHVEGATMAAILTPLQVKEAADGLAAIDSAAFADRFDFDAMMADEIYPLREGEDEKELYDYLWQNFSDLKAFYQSASASGNYVVFEIC